MCAFWLGKFKYKSATAWRNVIAKMSCQMWLRVKTNPKDISHQIVFHQNETADEYTCWLLSQSCLCFIAHNIKPVYSASSRTISPDRGVCSVSGSAARACVSGWLTLRPSKCRLINAFCAYGDEHVWTGRCWCWLTAWRRGCLRRETGNTCQRQKRGGDDKSV